MKPLLAAARHLPRLYLPLLLALCGVQTWRTMGGGDDFWAHAAIGRWIVAHGEVPQRTLFLWGDSQPWIAHSWGTQVWFYELMQLGGERGGPYLALLFACAMLALCLALLWREWARRGHVSVLAVLFFALAAWCGATRARPRPELFSSLFFTLLLIYLLCAAPPKSPLGKGVGGWRCALIVAMFALWANLHGGVAAGLLLIVVTALCDGAQCYFEKRDARPAWRLLALGAGCALAINLNPYGLHYWLALREVRGEMFSHIDEWKPFWKWPAMDLVFPATGFLLAFFALLSWLGTAPRRWAHGAWLLVWTALFISARRHLWMLSLVSLAVLSVNAEAVAPQIFWKALLGILKKENADAPIPNVWRAAARWATVIFLVTVILRQAPSAWLRRWPHATAKELPAPAAKRLLAVAASRPQLRLFNDYEFSSYLQWRCAGQPPLFIDLLNAYRGQLLLDYFEMAKASKTGRVLLKKRGVNCVFLRHHKDDEVMHGLAKALDKDPAWRRVYAGDDATIWLKN